jgi:hypothetical protein
LAKYEIRQPHILAVNRLNPRKYGLPRPRVPSGQSERRVPHQLVVARKEDFEAAKRKILEIFEDFGNEP